MNNLVKNSHKKKMVILADVRHSRQIENRSEVQVALRQVTESVYAEKSSLLTIPFSISGGDAVQGMLAQPTAMFEIIDHLDLDSFLFEFRFGVGWGSVATPTAERTGEMDGECFHHASDALLRGKSQDRWVTVAGFGQEGDQILNSVFRLMQVIRKDWTQKQRTAVATRKTRKSQTESAEEMGLDNSTLSKMLKAAKYKQLVEIEEAMPLLIQHLLEGTP